SFLPRMKAGSHPGRTARARSSQQNTPLQPGVFAMHGYDEAQVHHAPNVHGWERTLSIAGGFFLLACGLRKAGLTGLEALGLDGMTLADAMPSQRQTQTAISCG